MTIPPRAGVLIFLAMSSAALASEFADLKREAPVLATEPIPVIDFVRPVLYQQPQINYTGTQIGAIVPGDDDHESLVTYNRLTQKLDGMSARGDRDISSFAWLDGDRLICIMSEKKIVGRVILSGEAGKLVTSTPLRIGSSASIIAIPPGDRTSMLMNLFGFGLRYDHPATLNARDFGHVLVRYPELKTDHGFNTGFVADKKGALAFGFTAEDGVFALSQLAGESWVKCPEDLDQVSVFGCGDEPGQIVVLGPRDGTGPRPLEFMDATSGKPGEVILQDKSYDFDGWLFRDPATHDIVGAIYDRAGPHVVWFTEAYRHVQKLVDALFPGQIVRILGMDDAGKTLLIMSGSDRQPPIYSWVDLEKHTSGLIKNSEPWIDPARMQPMGVIKYQTSDGKTLDAYITLPAGASKKNPPPLVVIPHAVRDGRARWGFDSDAQFLASRGYAVLQPNYRGSAGYTWMFPETDNWEFRKMGDDVAQATKAVIAKGLVDPKRVAIMGQEFGGYLAVAGAAYQPGLYKCAVSVSAFYDWGRYIREDKYEQFTNITYSRYLYKLGDPNKNAERYDSMSPLLAADQIHSALFLAWGEFDAPEVIGQSKSLGSKVEKNGNTVETLSFIDEANGVRHLAHRVELYQHLEAFLAKNL